jgi:hypothetical protein
LLWPANNLVNNFFKVLKMKKLITIGIIGLAIVGFASMNSIGQSADPNALPPAPADSGMPPAPEAAPPPPEMASNPPAASATETKPEAKKIKGFKPNTLVDMPKSSKLVFKRDLVIPANQHEVLLGSTGGGHKTECTLKLNNASNALRMIPKGTKFEIADTKIGYGQSTDLMVISNSINALSCVTYSSSEPSQLMSTDQFQSTSYHQASRASGGVIKIEVNNQPELIVN